MKKFPGFMGVWLAIFALFLSTIAMIIVMLSSSKSSPPLRKVTLYNYDGKIIKEYDGKITYITRGSGGVKFWSDDKRVIIQGGIIVVEDK